MYGLGATVLDLDAFVAHLRASGWTVRGVASTRVDLDLEGGPIDFVSLHFKGGSFAGVFPLAGGAKLKVEYRYTLNIPRAYPWLATKLVQEKKGVFDRKRVAMTWTGALLGARFAADDALMRALDAHLLPTDDLSVMPVPDERVVRIVHASSYGVRLNLFDADPAKVNRALPPPELLGAFGRMAVHIRQGTLG